MSLPRRAWLQGVGASLAAAALSGCNRVTEDPRIVKALASAEDLKVRALAVFADHPSREQR